VDFLEHPLLKKHGMLHIFKNLRKQKFQNAKEHEELGLELKVMTH